LELRVAAVSIRDLDDGVRERLRVRAAQNGRSMEAEMRAILTAAVSDNRTPPHLLSTLRERFAEVGGIDLDIPPRATPARAITPPA
jgi:antitoxin FitA